MNVTDFSISARHAAREFKTGAALFSVPGFRRTTDEDREFASVRIADYCADTLELANATSS